MFNGIWFWVKEYARLATTGGRWAKEIPDSTQKNLRWFFLDGILGAGLDGIAGPFLSLYMLALGATSGQIGLMTSLAGLFATLLLLPGAMLSERTGKRKLIFVLSGAGAARFSILLFALLPFVLARPTAIYFIILIKVMADGLGNFSGPAWTSMAGDIVPLAWRGRYFGSRNFFMAIGSMLATFLAGNLISHYTSIAGYQIAFGLAWAAGMTSTSFFLQVKEPKIAAAVPGAAAFSIQSVLKTFFDDRVFRHYAVFSMIWNLSIGVGGPYFLLFMVERLKATPADVGIFTIAGSLSALPALRLFGHLSDSWGTRKVMLVTGLLIPLLPLAWILARVPLNGTMINIPGGMLWAGFNLAAFNFLLSLAPSEKRARYAALFQIVVALSSATGTFLGSLILTHWGYLPIFAVSGIGRFIGMGYFLRFVRGPITSSALPV
jgi:MFS family permease